MTGELAPWLLLGLSVLGALILLRRPLGAAAKLAVRSAAGLGGIWLFNQVGALVGIHLGVNLLTGLIVGLLGLPGFGLLLLLQLPL